MFWALQGPMRVASRVSGGVTLEKMLLQRHRIIDHLLETAIAEGRVAQVVEVAAGLSGRGYRLTRRHPGLVYVEGDLPDMAARKRALLAGLPDRSPDHHLVTLDALRDEGDGSIAAATRSLVDRSRGAAVVTEGLLTYFPRHQVLGMWRRFAEFLSGFSAGSYLSDLHIDDRAHRSATFRTMRALIGVVSRGRVHISFEEEREAHEELSLAGFSSTALHRPKALAGALDLPLFEAEDIIGILEART
jgi:O-methyltransferase involved in polyketide biosynthesis